MLSEPEAKENFRQAPSELVGTALSETEIGLAWIDESDNETGFEIMRALGENMIWEMVDQVGPDTETYRDEALSKGKLYHYMVRAKNDFGTSPFSDSISISTLGVGLDRHTQTPAAIYPNPLSKGDLYISFSVSSEGQVIITDLSGNRVFELRTTASDVKVSREVLYPGLFIVTLVQGEKSRSEKIQVL